MAPRAYWKGYLKLSLVSCPIALFPATSERGKISFHQLNKKTGNRIKYRKVDAESGDEVDSADIIKGYEVGKGDYIELDPEELEAVAIESKRTIDIDEFVPKDEIDELYLNNPYYIGPDGEVGQQAFAVIREAIRKEGKDLSGCPGLGEPQAETPPSILFGQHDRDHALGDRRISRIRRVVTEALVEVVDLEEHLVAVGIERAKVVLLVRVVGVTEISA